jgi:hypothetical protein
MQPGQPGGSKQATQKKIPNPRNHICTGAALGIIYAACWEGYKLKCHDCQHLPSIFFFENKQASTNSLSTKKISRK